MVAAKESRTYQQISAWNSSYMDPMLLLQHKQTYGLPQFPSSTPTAKVPFPGQPAGMRSPFSGQRDSVGGFLNRKPPYSNVSLPTGIPYLNTQCALPQRLGVTEKRIDASCAPEKRFLIFDKSGSRTRLLSSPSFSPQSLICSSKTPPSASGLCGGVAARAADEEFLTKPIEEMWDENHVTDGEEDEMVEDTEEINALLYSDSYDDEEYDSEYDEVTSTGHSPFITEQHCNVGKPVKELMEEEASSDELQKRRRLLDGNYKKPSMESVESPTRQPILCSYEDDMESICAGNNNSYHDTKREKKLRIRRALKVLESIVPEVNNKDPVSIIDRAIIYLKSMRAEAEALELMTSPTPP